MVSPNGRYVVCANAMSDNLSVVDTTTDTVAETIWAKPRPNDLLGASPNALAFAPDGRTLYVANGTQNAVAVIRFDPADKESELIGLIPVGWYLGTVCFDAKRKQLGVANIKSISNSPHTKGFNSRQFQGTVSLVPLPSKDALPRLSQVVWDNLRQPRIADALLPPRAGQPARAIPERIGEPSLITHVVYIIKETRTYDQILGDVTNGNAVVSTQYNTTSLLRTMEQILGLPPMNPFDASAVPMSDCFSDGADLTPFASVTNNIPLDQMNPESKTAMSPQQYRDMLACEKMNFSVPDKVPEDKLNRILWRATRGDAEPYPAWAITPTADND